MLIRRELPGDAGAIRAVHASAFAATTDPGRIPVEVGLVDALRAGDAWLPELSLVALDPAGEVTGHVVCSRGHVGPTPALGLGPLGVVVSRQGRGVGAALMHAVLAAADALGEPLVALLGHVDYYPRFGFRHAVELGIQAPAPEWGPNFMVRTLTAHRPTMTGTFAYAAPFDEV